MAGENGTENGGSTELEATQPSGNGNGDVVELTRTQLDELIANAVQEANAPLVEQLNAARTDLDNSQQKARIAEVKETLRELQDAGHGPKVLQRVGEILLADTGETELTLSRKGDDGSDVEEKMSASDIVLSILEISRDEKLELTQRQPRVPAGQRPPQAQNDDRPVDEQAKEILDELRGSAVRLSSTA